jgi:hypothetical protein
MLKAGAKKATPPLGYTVYFGQPLIGSILLIAGVATSPVNDGVLIVKTKRLSLGRIFARNAVIS